MGKTGEYDEILAYIRECCKVYVFNRLSGWGNSFLEMNGVTAEVSGNFGELVRDIADSQIISQEKLLVTPDMHLYQILNSHLVLP